jgi:aminobenzoyl-glutamate utilization protein B
MTANGSEELMIRRLVIAWFMVLGFGLAVFAQSPAQSYKTQLAKDVDGMAKETQVMVDTVFSFGELGFQEFETSKYLTGILEKEGFKVERGISGIPTAWMATWGSGKPVIALGSDIDCIPQASQKPGVAYHDPLIEGAPGHGDRGRDRSQAIDGEEQDSGND